MAEGVEDKEGVAKGGTQGEFCFSPSFPSAPQIDKIHRGQRLRGAGWPEEVRDLNPVSCRLQEVRGPGFTVKRIGQLNPSICINRSAEVSADAGEIRVDCDRVALLVDRGPDGCSARIHVPQNGQAPDPLAIEVQEAGVAAR